jgi:hypothetical protein
MKDLPCTWLRKNSVAKDTVKIEPNKNSNNILGVLQVP